jgi:hypothetical protein
VLTGYDANEQVIVTNSRFINNGNPDREVFQHALYVNLAGLLWVDNSLFCGQLIGHDVKSRALVTMVTNSQLYVGAADPADGCDAGSTSYGIDATNGGILEVFNDQFFHGPTPENYVLIDYGAEGLLYDSNALSVIGNTFTSSRTYSLAVYDPPCIPAVLDGNSYSGGIDPLYPPQCDPPGAVPSPASLALPEPGSLTLLVVPLAVFSLALASTLGKRRGSFPLRGSSRVQRLRGEGLSFCPIAGKMRKTGITIS